MYRKLLTILASVAILAMLPLSPARAAYGTLHIVGNRWTTISGHQVWLQGVNRASLEYGSSDPLKAHCNGDGHFTLTDFQTIRTAWHSDMIRIPLSSNNWLGDYDALHGTAYGHEGDPCPGYDAFVEQIASTAASSGMYVLFSLAHVDPCSVAVNSTAGAGYDLPSRDEAVNFWTTFASDPAMTNSNYVWFDAYSEPHDVTWQQWYSGGTVTQVADTQRAGCTYTAAGMYTIVQTIRSVAPYRPILVSGNGWGGDITRINAYSFAPYSGVGFGVHIYPGPDTTDESKWPSFFANMATYPVIATEFGVYDCSTSGWVSDLEGYLAAHAAGMLAWGYNSGACGGPRLLNSDWSIDSYGAAIQGAFVAVGKLCATC